MARWPFGVNTRECACHETVFDASVNGVPKPMDAKPHADGIYVIRDAGTAFPVAVRLTVAQQFGRQGTLHNMHKCKIAKRKAHKW